MGLSLLLPLNMQAFAQDTSTFGGQTAQQAANVNSALGIQPTMPNYVGTGVQQQPQTTEKGAADTSYVGQNGITYNNRTGLPIGQTPLMTAQVQIPTSYGNNPAPAVYNANKANSYLGNVGTQIQNLNNDSQVQSQAKSLAAMPPQEQDTSQSQSGSQGQDNGQTQTNTTDPAAQLNEQISDILNSLGQGESNLNDQLSNATTADNNGNQVSYQQAEQENQLQEILGYQQTASLLNQIQSGTYPLSAPEQQLLSSTQSSFEQAIQQQQVANNAYTGQMAEAMASLGINQTAPVQAIGNIQGAISNGQSKIADLDTQMAQSVSQLQLSFQKQDFDEVQQQWDNMSKQFTDRQTALSDMQKQVADAVQQQKTDMQQFATTALSAINSSAQFTLSEKQDNIDNAFKQQQITETQRSDMANEAVAYQNSLKGVYTFEASTGQVFDTRTGQVVGQTQNGVVNGTVTPGNTGIPIVDSNTRTTASGVPYVDGTTLTGAQAQTAQLQAAKLGIPYVGSAGAGALNKLEEARQNIANIKDVLTGASGGNNISPSNGFTRLLEIPNYAAEGLTQDGPEATQIAAYNTFRSAAIGALQAVAGGSGSGLRINQAEIQMSIQNDIPTPTDTSAVRDQKIANMTSLLDSNEAQLLGTQVWAKYNPNSPVAQQSNALDQLVGSSSASSQGTGTASLDNLSQQFGI